METGIPVSQRKASCTERKGRTEISRHLCYSVPLTSTQLYLEMADGRMHFCRLEGLQVLLSWLWSMMLLLRTVGEMYTVCLRMWCLPALPRLLAGERENDWQLHPRYNWCFTGPKNEFNTALSSGLAKIWSFLYSYFLYIYLPFHWLTCLDSSLF